MHPRRIVDLLWRLGGRVQSTTRRTAHATVSERLEDRVLLTLDAMLVKDINPQFAASSSPSDFTDVNGTLFFTALSPTAGRELWKSDGSPAGTVQVAEIRPGSGSAFPSLLMNVNGTLYFTANDGLHGFELWKSDGTALGTVLVKDIFAGADGSRPGSLTNLDGTLYFTANDGVHGDEIWKSDGTEAGTVLVEDIFSGPNGSAPSSLTALDGTLYFAADDGVTGVELWKAENSVPGAVQVADIFTGTSGSFPDLLTEMNGTLYFSATSAAGGRELWKSNGASGGTSQVADIIVGDRSSSPSSLTNVNGTLFFSAETIVLVESNDPDHPEPIETIGNREIWKSDGTDGGTQRVKDIRPGDASSYSGTFTNVNGTLFFVATDGVGGKELWKSDGTDAGTVQVKDIATGVSGSFPAFLTEVNGNLYFVTGSGAGLWQSDGTAVGTFQVASFDSSLTAITPNSLTNINETLFFAARTLAEGVELWGLLDATTAPQITPIPSPVIPENGSTGALDFTLSDPDSDVNGLIVSVTSSSPSLIPKANIVVTGSGSQRSLSITPARDQTGSATITVQVSDGVLSSRTTVVITVTPVEHPTIIELNSQPLVYYVSGRKIVAIDDAATISDVDLAPVVLNGAILRVSGQSGKDKISILEQGDLSLRRQEIIFGKTVIGTYTGGNRGTPLEVHFNRSATLPAVQHLLRRIGFKSTDRSSGNRTVQFQLSNISGATIVSDIRQIQVVP